MDDLISRQEAIEAIVKESHKDGAYGYVDASDATKALNALPSADIDLSGFSDKLWKTAYERGKAEVVRCKDCKWYKTNYSWNGKEHKVCVIEPYEPVRKGDDFCSRGERKDA